MSRLVKAFCFTLSIIAVPAYASDYGGYNSERHHNTRASNHNRQGNDSLGILSLLCCCFVQEQGQETVEVQETVVEVQAPVPQQRQQPIVKPQQRSQVIINAIFRVDNVLNDLRGIKEKLGEPGPTVAQKYYELLTEAETLKGEVEALPTNIRALSETSIKFEKRLGEIRSGFIPVRRDWKKNRV